jgi:signal transduction histidine kinase/CheY-like chemotaxis protein
VHADDRAAAAAAMDTLSQRDDGMVELDLRLLGHDGVLRHVATRTTIETAGGQRRVFGVMLDMTARRTTEERLRQAGERALLIARGAGVGTWESAPDVRLGWWDEQMYRLRGREPRGEPISIDEMLEWVHPEDRLAFDTRVRDASAKAYPASYEFRVIWPDGSVRWIASRSSSLLDAQGRVVRRIGINWDVTEARQAAAALQDKLLAQRESQAKSRFLARMSHELRTPLNAVLGFSQLLLAEGKAPDPASWRERIEHVRAAGEHLLTLVNDVLDLSALESGELPLQLQPVALATLVRTTLPMLQTQADAAAVRLHAGQLEGHALADPVRLRQALINLLSNGIKYNRRGGNVWVDAAPRDGRICLAVRDDGLGLSDAQRAHLFEPFNRLGREREFIDGTGIGLAIVKASIERMDGSVEVRSREGEGSCFELRLPQAEPSAAPAVPAAAIPMPAATGDDGMPPWRPHLLYIEDNPVNLLIVSEMLRLRPDLRLDTAINGRDGLLLARLHRPPLVLIDMQLPDIDGLQVLRELRADAQTAALRCVALSANAMPDDVRAALAAGFDDYWTKPLDMSAFMAALAAMFGPPPKT